MADRRKRYLVQSFQYKLGLRIIAYWLVYTSMLWVVLACWHLLKHGQGDFFLEHQQFVEDYYPLVLISLILAPVFAWDAIRFYHTIAGPLVQFRRMINAIADEKPVHPIKLRKTDELMDLQDDFNRMLETLARRQAVAIEGNHFASACKDHAVEPETANLDSSDDVAVPVLHADRA
jgi:methyl-accepting chemotaxis protein